MPQSADVRKDLSQEFTIKDDSQLDAFAAIGAFLSGSPETRFPTGTVLKSAIDGLTLLNGAIEGEVMKGTPQTRKRMRENVMAMMEGAKIKANDPLTEPERNLLCRLLRETKAGRAAARYPDHTPVIQANEAAAFEGVLQKVLLENERLNGFHLNQSGHPYLLYSFTGLLSPESFLKAVKDGYQWKDIGVSLQHGVFSHRIQWYLITKGGFLKEPDTIFKAIGNAQYMSQTKDVLSQYSLWARLCDRPNKPSPAGALELGTSSETDLRSPERVTAHVMKNEKTLPWLHASVAKTQEKYNHLFDKEAAEAQKQYHTKKTASNGRFVDVEPGIMRRR